MTGLAWLARATIDVPSNMEMLFGTMFGTAAWPLGFAIHLTGS